MAETKAGKAVILAFMKAWGNTTPYDLVDKFDFTLAYARKRLTMLKKQGLVADSRANTLHSRGSWFLTNKGERREVYFHEQGTCSEEWCRHSGEHGTANIRSAKKNISIEQQKISYIQGYKDAESRFCISYSCSICGNEVDIDSPEEKEAIKRYMESERWAHAQCISDESGRKGSINAIRKRLIFLLKKQRIFSEAVREAVERGMRTEQIDMSEFYANHNEIRKLLPLFPANEQIEILNK
jgi:hypothetical protein